MRFELTTAGRIVFGPGTLKEVVPVVQTLGKRPLVVTGRSRHRTDPLLSLLQGARLEADVFNVAGEPTTATIIEGVACARDSDCDLVIGMGGGSALDAAKAIAALMTNDGDLFDYLEVIGKGRPLTRPAAPCVTVPTTAGTGAEVTRNAVLAATEHRVKVSLRSQLMLPRLAVVDPELTLGLPRAVTAATGLDALTQLIEPYVSCRANPLTDGFCVEGMRRVARSLRRVCGVASEELAAREDMALASLFGGLALANAGLGAVHGFAGPIGGMFPAPHGAVCAALLPHAMEINLAALKTRSPNSRSAARYDEVARLLTGNPAAVADDGVRWVAELTEDLEIPSLGTYGIQSADLEILSEKAAVASSMKANPIELTPAERLDIVSRSL